MDKKVKSYFDGIRNDFTKHKASVTAILSTYRRDNAAAKEAASKFKDEQCEYKARQAGLISTARSKLAEADKALADSIQYYHIPHLKDELTSYITAKPSAAFLDVLRIFKDFDISMGRAELDSLIRASEGNFVALRALQSTAKASGYDLTIPTVEQFEADIQAIERIAHPPLMYTPHEYVGEAQECFPDLPLRRADGSIYGSAGRPSAIDLITAAARYDHVCNNLEATGSRWSASVVPGVSTLNPIKNENGETVSVEEQHEKDIADAASQVDVDNTTAEDMAAALGQARAEESAKAAAILAQYTK